MAGPRAFSSGSQVPHLLRKKLPTEVIFLFYVPLWVSAHSMKPQPKGIFSVGQVLAKPPTVSLSYQGMGEGGAECTDQGVTEALHDGHCPREDWGIRQILEKPRA